jgi:hypothetical protein
MVLIVKKKGYVIPALCAVCELALSEHVTVRHVVGALERGCKHHQKIVKYQEYCTSKGTSCGCDV